MPRVQLLSLEYCFSFKHERLTVVVVVFVAVGDPSDAPLVDDAGDSPGARFEDCRLGLISVEKREREVRRRHRQNKGKEQGIKRPRRRDKQTVNQYS